MAIAIVIALCLFFAARKLGDFLVWRYYLDDNEKQERLDKNIRELTEYVDANKLSVDDTDKIISFFDGKYVDIIIYKDSKLIFAPEWFEKYEGVDSQSEDGTIDETEAVSEDGSAVTEKPAFENTEISSEAFTEDLTEIPAESLTDTGLAADETAELESEMATESGSDENSTEDDKNVIEDGWFSGDRSFLQYLTEEDKKEYQAVLDNILAGNAELQAIECIDGTLLVTLVDYSEKFIYNLVLFISIACAVLAVAIIMTISLTRLVSRVTKLASSVKSVGEGDLTKPIAVDGNDEIASLAFDVNTMRDSIIENITKEQRAWEANTSLITAMSHDIRTPLTVLLGYLDLMEIQNADPSSSEYITICKENALRLKRLSDDMFSYFLVFGKNEATFENVSEYSTDSITHMIMEHEILLEETGYVFKHKSDIPDLKVVIDAMFFGRVIDNIFSNIIKYADTSSAIIIDSDFDGEMLVISFENKIKKDDMHAESNHIGIKTCVQIMEKLNGSFETAVKDGTFSAIIKLPASK